MQIVNLRGNNLERWKQPETNDRVKVSNLRNNGQELRITSKQRALLHDLHIHCGEGIPSRATERFWDQLTRRQAKAEIKAWYRHVGNYGMYGGPEAGEPEYEALSAQGKKFADEGGDVFFDWGYECPE